MNLRTPRGLLVLAVGMLTGCALPPFDATDSDDDSGRAAGGNEPGAGGRSATDGDSATGGDDGAGGDGDGDGDGDGAGGNGDGDGDGGGDGAGGNGDGDGAEDNGDGDGDGDGGGDGGQSNHATGDRGDKGTGGEADGGSSTGGSSTGGTSNVVGQEIFAGEGDWVDSTTNEVGIGGPFYNFTDTTWSVLNPSQSFAGSDPCIVYGSIGPTQTTDGDYCDPYYDDDPASPYYCDYDAGWGATIGFNLNQPAGEEAPQPFDAEAAGITGFIIRTEGYSEAPVRFKVKEYGSDAHYCVQYLYPGVSHTILLDELERDCWIPGGEPPDASNLESLGWDFVAGYSYAFAVQNYCIASISYF